MFRAVGQTDRKKERHDKSNIRFSKFYESALKTVIHRCWQSNICILDVRRLIENIFCPLSKI